MAAPMIELVILLLAIIIDEQRITQRRRERKGARRHLGEAVKVAKAELGDGDFFVGAEGVAHGVADFAEGGVGFYGVEDEGH
jgi:hypothetical protein